MNSLNYTRFFSVVQQAEDTEGEGKYLQKETKETKTLRSEVNGEIRGINQLPLH